MSETASASSPWAVPLVEIANAARALNQALVEIHDLIDRKRAGEPFRELLQHAHQMVDMFVDTVRRIRSGPDAPRALALAARLDASLGTLEREIARTPLH